MSEKLKTPELFAPEIPTNGKALIPTPMNLLSIALENNAAIDVIERLAALQDKAVMRDAEMQFNQAMEAAQNEISSVVPDLMNDTTHTKYASFKALNKAIRPVYLRHGFTLSFNAGQSDKPEEILVLCDCSHKGGCTKKYLIPMPTDGKGAKGGGVMSKSHATLSATSYGRSCLLKLIFNIAIAEAELGDSSGPHMDLNELLERIEYFPKCETFGELKAHYEASYLEAKKIKDQSAIDAIIAAKEKRKLELKKIGAQ